MTTQTLVTLDSRDSGVAFLILNRPDKLNALSQQMLHELIECLDRATEKIEKQKIKVLIVRSSHSKAFCVGADLNERILMSHDEVIETLDQQNLVMNKLASLPIPTIAVIEGAAFGGGLELALACDLRLASETSQLSLSETRLGIIPGAGGTQRLTRIVGVAKSKELIFRAVRMSGAEAEKISLVNACVENPLKVSDDWALELLSAAPLAIRAAKRSIEGGLDLDMNEALNWERKCYEMTLSSEDRVEGLKAFAEKRKAIFKGK